VQFLFGTAENDCSAKESTMKVSVIVPVYNVSKYIERCVDSMINQTYEDIECIFVDDCSSDNSVEIIAQKIAMYAGLITFEIIHHKQNKGSSGARNTGIEASTGDYLFFLDSDDEISNNCIELLVDLALRYPDVDIVQGSSNVIDRRHLNRMYLLKKSLPEFTKDHVWLKTNVLKRVLIPVTPWNKLINRNFTITNNLYFQEGIICEDELWTYFVAKCIKAIAFCKIPIYQHYINEGSVMTSNPSKRISSWLIIINSYINNIDPDLSRFQRKVILEGSFGNLVRIIKGYPQISIDDILAKQRRILNPCIKSARKRHQIFELLLLSYNYFPKFLLKFLCMNGVKSIYLGILKYLV